MFGALESLPVLPDALVGAGLGALLGSWVAYRHHRGGGTLPRDWIVTRWSVFIAAGFALIALGAELL